MEKLSVVVIEYHSLDEISRFYDSAKEFLSGMDYEIIVSSNSLYGEKDQQKVMRRYPAFRWLFNPRNGGFAYGMNQGLAVATGDYLVIANPDVRLQTSLSPMLDCLREYPQVGIAGPRMVDETGTIQDSFRHFATPFRFFDRQVGRIVRRNRLNVKQEDQVVRVDWVIGAFMMTSRSFYEKVGGLSEDYFMYCEDMDWCKRASLAGYEVAYVPQTVVQYKGTRSSRTSLRYARIHLQSLCTFWRKYGIF